MAKKQSWLRRATNNVLTYKGAIAWAIFLVSIGVAFSDPIKSALRTVIGAF